MGRGFVLPVICHADVQQCASRDCQLNRYRICRKCRFLRCRQNSACGKLVGAERFELSTFCSQGRRANQAALHPDIGKKDIDKTNKLSKRTPDLPEHAAPAGLGAR